MFYISIESRKGGVGKTTTALTLAETLLGEGYQVLMIDMDIIGTTLDPTFINSNEGFIHEVKLKGEAVNLVRLFKEIYMAGRNIPSFVSEEEDRNMSFSFACGKCNFIGSNIYGSPKGTTLLEDPRILYDAYHAFWLLELVKGISNSFASALGGEKKTAVILDNSPGFSSVENCIHDFLTDLGPEIGKVLLVSTIDPQDIEVCRQSKDIIEALFEDKVAAGEYYRSMIEKGVGEKRKTPAFETVWNCLCASGGRQPAYHSKSHKEKPSYVNILANKVPRNIFETLFTKGVLRRGVEVGVPFLNHLLYYFSTSQLAANEIAHQQAYMDRFNQYLQTGNVVDVEKDDASYLEFCKVSRQIGLGNFFKKEWAPLARFRDIVNILVGQEIAKEQPEWTLSIPDGGFTSKETRIADEVEVVEKFVINNLRDRTEPMREVLPFVVEYVSSVIREKDENAEADFHPEHPRLQEIGDFVTSFGLAAYRLHIYGESCELVNKLIDFCLKDVENLEKLNKDSVSSWMENVLEGRTSEQDVVGTLLQMLNDRRSARDLSEALQSIVKSWEL